jgi:hypothetical protein
MCRSTELNTFYTCAVSGSEDLTAVTMKVSVFYDIPPCSPVKVDQRFEGRYTCHLQGRRVNETETNIRQVSCRALFKTMFLRNVG